MTTFEKFKEDAEKQMTWLDKLFMNYPEMITTKKLADLTNNLKCALVITLLTVSCQSIKAALSNPVSALRTE